MNTTITVSYGGKVTTRMVKKTVLGLHTGVMDNYIIKVTSKSLDGKDNIERNFELHQKERVKGDLIPIVRLLQRVSQSNNAT